MRVYFGVAARTSGIMLQGGVRRGRAGLGMVEATGGLQVPLLMTILNLYDGLHRGFYTTDTVP